MAFPAGKNTHRLSERLASLGIMEARMREPSKTPQYDSVVMVKGNAGGGPNYANMIPEILQSLGIMGDQLRTPS